MSTPTGSRSAPVIAVDVGGTQVRGAIVAGRDITSRTATRWAHDTASANADLALIVDIVTSLRDAAPDAVAVGIAMAAMVDEYGVVQSWPNRPWWQHARPRDDLEDRVQMPIVFHDDAVAAAMAEATLGAASHARRVLGVTAGTGIGGGVVIDRRVLRGAHGWAGDLGHIVVEADGPPCLCGRRGCLQLRAGGRAVELAQVTLEEAGRSLGLAAGAMSTFLDLDAVVVIDGGLVEAGRVWWDALEAGFRDTVRPETELLIGQLGDNAGLFGVAILATEGEAIDP